MASPFTTIARDRFSRERFPEALKGLMEERRLSYRQLAYKTKLSAGYLNHLTKGTRPVPADQVLAIIATALCVEADYFLEFRVRQVTDVLDQAPMLADTLYGILLREQPVSDEVLELLSNPPGGDGSGGNGGNGGNGHKGNGNGNGNGNGHSADAEAIGF
jgi:transcriptional regulator with XRE-family HTH domain